MSSDLRNDLQQLVVEIRKILDPLAKSMGDEAIRREILLALGLDPSQSSQSIDIPPSSLASIEAYQRQSADDADLQAFISVLADITKIVQALFDFIQSVAAADSDAPAGFIVEEAVTFFLQAITISYLRARQPGVYITGRALQLFEDQAIHFGSIKNILFNIGDYFADVFGDATDLQTEEHAKALSDVILFVLGAITASLVDAEFNYGYDAGPDSDSPIGDAANNRTLTMRLNGKTKDTSGNDVKGSLLLSMVLIPREHGGPGVVTRIQGTGSLEVPVTKNLSFKFDVEAPDIIFYAGEGSLNFPSSTDASVAFSMIYKSKAEKEIIWGDVNGIHLRIGSTKLEGKVGAKDQSIKGEIKDSAFVLATQSADGFLKTILDAIASDGKLETKFNFNMGYSKKKGFFVGGGAGLMLSIPLHEELGPIKFNTLIIGFALSAQGEDDDGIKLEASLSFGMDLGVLQASVDRIGLAGLIIFENGDFELDFKPPNGIGLAVDIAGVVRGGGFLNFDFDRGEYAGGLELEIMEIVTVTAFGLITTRLPDGSEGFSLVAILAVEFSIQLGGGFTWNGIGGIFGLNRTMQLEAMAAGIKTGSAERILFPQNIVANAAQIISDLRVFFPPEADTFLVGGMLKFGYGTPTFISLSLGVIVQIPPGKFAILGVLKLVLPDENAALLQLKVGFIGAYEPDKERAWFYATLYDSRVLLMTLEGGMGVLIAWGETNSNFIISVGGFHPQFTPPPLPFPVPDRLSINILNYPLAKIRVMAYFAITSNTVQFGARAELFFGFDSVRLEGHLGLDVLFQFSPFYFIAQVSASVSLKVFGAGLFSVRLKGSLEGTSPWRIKGKASISILFFSISVKVNEEWGEEVDTVLPGVAAMPLLQSELEADSNWQADVPANNRLLVSLRKLDGTDDGLVLHPLGRLSVSQRKMPLGIKIDKIGNQDTTDASRFTLSVEGSGITKVDDQSERFAIAQYQKLDDTAKLSSPAYQSLTGGLLLSAEGRQTRSSQLVKRNVRYELSIIDNNFKQFTHRFFVFWVQLFTHFTFGSAVTKLDISFHKQKQMKPFDTKVITNELGFAVAKTRDNRSFVTDDDDNALFFSSQVLAQEYMNQEIARDPKLAEAIHVIPEYEVNK